MELLGQAPRDSILAGTGDMVSNLSAIEDWRLAERDIGEPIDDYALLISSQSAQMVLRYLEKSVAVDSKTYLEVLVEGLILSGIAMNIAGNSRPASGAEHEISHAIDALFPKKARLHGYQVAFGTLVADKIRGKDTSKLKELFASIGLPIHFQNLGLTLEEAVAALLHAPKTRPERYSILKKRKLTASEGENILLTL
jgi:glycerol-1-phosphate dehydrogenase [NAD(P)+]